MGHIDNEVPDFLHLLIMLITPSLHTYTYNTHPHTHTHTPHTHKKKHIICVFQDNFPKIYPTDAMWILLTVNGTTKTLPVVVPRGHGAICPHSAFLLPYLPSSTPSPRQKNAKIRYFQQIFGLLPPQKYILPPQCPNKKILVPALNLPNNAENLPKNLDIRLAINGFNLHIWLRFLHMALQIQNMLHRIFRFARISFYTFDPSWNMWINLNPL